MSADVIKVGPLGPYDNNSYIIVDQATKAAIFVDAPIGVEAALAAAKDVNVQRIVVTHRHGDHWAGIDAARDTLGCDVYCHADDAGPYKGKVDGHVEGGDHLSIGGSLVSVIHTPGHTPGSICLLVDGVLISGDTLFPGGPGRSDSPEALHEMVGSISSRLLTLPDDTAVYPGHGANTTIAEAKREYAVFASKIHPPDLCGDVTWAG